MIICIFQPILQVMPSIKIAVLRKKKTTTTLAENKSPFGRLTTLNWQWVLLPVAIPWLKLLSALWCTIWCSGWLSTSVPGPGCCSEWAQPSQREHLWALPQGSREAGSTPPPCGHPALKPHLKDYVPISTNSLSSEGSKWEPLVKKFSFFFLFFPYHLTHSIQYMGSCFGEEWWRVKCSLQTLNI